MHISRAEIGVALANGGATASGWFLEKALATVAGAGHNFGFMKNGDVVYLVVADPNEPEQVVPILAFDIDDVRSCLEEE